MTTNSERDSENETASPSPKAKRRWLAFSLGTLLIATALLSCVLGYFGNILLRVRHQRAAIAKIEAAGGKVFLDYELVQSGQLVGTPSGPALVRWIVGEDAFATPAVLRWGPEHEDLSILLRLPELRELSLTGEQVTDRQMAIVARLQHLASLELIETNVTSEGLTELTAVPALRTLHVTRGRNHDELLKGISNLHNLESLRLDRSTVSTLGFSHLPSLSKLKRLEIKEAHQLTDEGLAHLQGMKSLESLCLFDTSVSGNGLAYLVDLPRLSTLILTRSTLTDEGLVHVAKCEKLMHLDLNGTEISDRGVAHIANLQNLRYLHLWGEGTTDQCIEVLQTLKNLEHLEIGPTVTKEAAHAFNSAQPNCEVFYFNGKTVDVLVP